MINGLDELRSRHRSNLIGGMDYIHDFGSKESKRSRQRNEKSEQRHEIAQNRPETYQISDFITEM